MNIAEYLIELGCDVNAQVADRKTLLSEKYKKWGIPHFLMTFPSLKLLKFFKGKIRDFNTPNAQLMTPLHLFCLNIKQPNLLNPKLTTPNDYQTKTILKYLLSNCPNPNRFDSDKALPILYAASNSQY